MIAEWMLGRLMKTVTAGPEDAEEKVRRQSAEREGGSQHGPSRTQDWSYIHEDSVRWTNLSWVG